MRQGRMGGGWYGMHSVTFAEGVKKAARQLKVTVVIGEDCKPANRSNKRRQIVARHYVIRA